MWKILFAEDETHMRSLVHATLEDDEYQITDAKNGAEAVEIARTLLPDLIILDWMMPRMTGLQATKEIRQHTELQRVPIVMLTARAQARDQVEGLAAGVDAYLIKPFSPLELLTRVDELLHKSAAKS